jgi:hypothetical protein
MKTSIDAILSIEHPRHFEANAAYVLRELPLCVIERTRDTIHIFYEGETGASLLFTPEGFEVRIPSLEWVDNHIPTPTTRLIDRYTYHDTRVLESGFTYLTEYMIDLLHKAVELRTAGYKECKFCKKIFPPEHRHSEDVYQSCARIHLRIVY